MTRKAGFSRVQMTSGEARSFARDLLCLAKLNHCHPVKPTLLSPDCADYYPVLRLVKDLIRASRYSRSFCELRTFHLREAIGVFDAAVSMRGYIPPGAAMFVNRCREAMPKKGAPWLTRKQLQLRIQQGGGDERERRRLRKRERLNVWIDGIRERGETLLTSTVDPP